MSSELDEIDASVARWCRRTATVESVGPFEIFIEPAPFAPKYARPTATSADLDDLEAVTTRLSALGLPVEIEAVAECHPGLVDLLSAGGWSIELAPVMIHRPGGSLASDVRPLGTADIRLIGWDDDDLARVDVIGHLAFSTPGMAVGAAGVDEAREIARSHDPMSNRERLRRGDMVMMTAVVAGEPVAYGSLLLDDGAPMAEIVAVGTIPSQRRRGLGAAVTASLVEEARRRGVETIWLSAADSDVAQMYRRLGFEHVGTYVMASHPPSAATESL